MRFHHSTRWSRAEHRPAGSMTGFTPTVSHTKGLPPMVTPTDTSEQSLVGWSDPGRMYLVTFGCGSCPKLLTSVSATGSDGPRTMDFGRRRA